jgi:predicted AAA+ superfamily ATPase
MWIERNYYQKILEAIKTRPALLLTGIRQSGKSSLLQKLFPEADYVTLDKVLLAEEAEINPSKFLNRFEKQVIIDEIQYAPSLFRELKIRIDENRNAKGKWILTGSQQFNLMQGITESLAGRIRIINLFPLSAVELNRVGIEINQKNYLWKGGFPEVWAENLVAAGFFEDYIQTYLERDLKQMLNVSNLMDFRRFVIHLALRTGQLVNYTEIAKDTGVSGNTIKSWINLLETSGLIYFLPPFYQNLGKRLIKAPKIYFCDNGLICALLNINSLQALENSPHLGNIWENFVFTELLKSGFTCGKDLFFYRDQNGVEIDFVAEKEGKTFLLEAKYSEIPKAGKLNFSKVAPLFPPNVQLLVACPANENTLVTLKDFSLYNPLLYPAFQSI